MGVHVRRQLREAVAVAVTGLATSGARVFKTRLYPLQSTDLPALLISTPGEEAAPTHVDGGLDRRVAVEIVALVKATDNVDDLLDQMAAEVEVALLTPVTVAGVGVLLDYEGCDDDFDALTDQPVGVLRLRYATTLYTTAPDILING